MTVCCMRCLGPPTKKNKEYIQKDDEMTYYYQEFETREMKASKVFNYLFISQSHDSRIYEILRFIVNSLVASFNWPVPV